jgi:ubiquinone/menaquinone biosynthesis C-methylase UbiE
MSDDGIIASAEAYDRCVGRYGRQLAQLHTAAAGVMPGHVVLDVGCGPGALTAVLAERVGAANVAAVEPSAAFAAVCAERVPGADVRVGTAEELPAFERSFEVVLYQHVVNIMMDPIAGVRAMRDATTPGGTVAS